MLVISEDWSSDCRRDVPTFARIAAETGMDLRVFNRDGQVISVANVPSLEEAPDSNADLMAQFLNPEVDRRISRSRCARSTRATSRNTCITSAEYAAI